MNTLNDADVICCNSACHSSQDTLMRLAQHDFHTVSRNPKEEPVLV